MYNPNDYTRGTGSETLTLSGAVSQVLKNVYGWMAVALAITALVSMGVASNEQLVITLATNQLLFWGVAIAEIGLVWYVSARINELSFNAAAIALGIYSALNGVTMSFLFLVYTMESIASTFWVCAATFGAMAFIGHTTKTDMSSWGKYFMMALIGLIIASIANIWIGGESLYNAISYLGVLLFVGLTAYDAQKIQKMVEYNYQYGALDMRKIALIGSLSLYLDFVNLFIYLLRIMGNRRN